MNKQEGNTKLNKFNQELLSDSVLVEAFFIAPMLFHRAEALCVGRLFYVAAGKGIGNEWLSPLST